MWKNQKRKDLELKSFFKQQARASFTVEAAFIVPITVIICALLLLCCFTLHNKIWYTGAAAESALIGNSTQTEKNVSSADAAKKRADERIAAQSMPGEKPASEVNVTENASTVSFGDTATVTVTAVKPAEVMRKLWATSLLLKG